MADRKIDEATLDDAVFGAELIPVSDAGSPKSMSVSQIKDYVIEQLMASGAITDVTGTWVMLRDSTGASKRIAIDNFKAALESTLVALAGAQTITGAKTFTGAVSVPSPTANGHAATRGYVDGALADKVDKVTGKSLSSNDFTDALLTKLNGIASGAQVNTVSSVNTKTGAVTLNATDVGAASNEPTFTQAATLAAPVGTGETTPTLWGKVWKAITTLVSHIGDSVAHVTSAERAEWSGKQGVLTFDEYPTALSNNPVKSKGILQRLGLKADSSALEDHANDTNAHVTAEEKSSWDQKQSTENLVASFQSSPDNTHYPSEKLVKDSLDDKADSSDLTTHENNTTVHVTAADKTAWNGKQAALVVGTNMDSTPTSSSSYPITSGGVFTALQGKQAMLVKNTNLDGTVTQNSDNPVTSGAVYTAIQNASGGGGGGDVVAPSTCTSGNIPAWSSTNKTLTDGYGVASTVAASGSASSSKLPTEAAVRSAIDAASSGGSQTAVDHSIEVSNDSRLKTISLGSASSKVFAITDSRSSEGYVQLTLGNSKGSGHEWVSRRATIVFPSAQTGEMRIKADTGHTRHVRSDGVTITADSSYDKFTMSAGKTYVMEATFVNNDTTSDVYIDVKEY